MNSDYVAHLPLVVALQIGLANWTLPWRVQLPLLNVVAFAILLFSYHACVRFTWLGGVTERPARRAAGSAGQATFVKLLRCH